MLGQRACERARWSSQTAMVRVRAGAGEREEEGGRPASVPRTSRHLVGRAGEARGGRRRLEGGVYCAGAHCSMLQSVQMAGMAFFCNVGAATDVW